MELLTQLAQANLKKNVQYSGVVERNNSIRKQRLISWSHLNNIHLFDFERVITNVVWCILVRFIGNILESGVRPEEINESAAFAT